MKRTAMLLSAAALGAQALSGVVVDAGTAGARLDHYWSFGVGAGRVNEGLRAAWHEHLARAKDECGFRYVRMHDTFNDDMFVTRPMAPARFFDEKTGLPTAQFCELPCYFKGHLNAWEIAIARSLGIINKWFPKKDVSLGSYFGKYCSFQYPFADNMRNLLMKIMFSGYYTGIRLFHSPAPYLKRTFEEIWEKEPDLLQQTTMHRFRNTDDVNQILPFCWQLVSGQFVPCRMRTVVNDVKAFRLDRLCEQISRQRLLGLSAQRGKQDRVDRRRAVAFFLFYHTTSIIEESISRTLFNLFFISS